MQDVHYPLTYLCKSRNGGGYENNPKLKKRNFPNIPNAFFKSRSTVSPDEF